MRKTKIKFRKHEMMDEQTPATQIISKAPIWAIGIAIVIISSFWAVAFFLKDTGLSTPIIKLIEAQTNASTDLTKEVKENTAAIRDLIGQTRATGDAVIALEGKTEKRFMGYDSRISSLEERLYKGVPESNTK
jgi:hypothetical protein